MYALIKGVSGYLTKKRGLKKYFILQKGVSINLTPLHNVLIFLSIPLHRIKVDSYLIFQASEKNG